MLASSSAAENITDKTDNNTDDHFFHGGHWGQCLELLSHLCQYSDSILLVTGQSGMGKSALKQALKLNISDRVIFCEIDASVDLDSDRLLQKIENGFDNALKRHNTDKINELEMVLLIDDAHKLPIDSIAALLQLKQTMGTQKTIHLVLFARPELEARIQRSPFKDKFNEQVHTIDLEPLTLNEVGSFLKHQWQLTDDAGDFPVDKSNCKKIYSMSGGVPGDVKKLAESFLERDNEGKKMKNRTNSKFSPFTVGLTVSMGLLFCFLAFLWPNADEKIVQTTSPINSEFRQANAESVVVSSLPMGPEVIATNDAPSFIDQPASDQPVNDQLAATIDPILNAGTHQIEPSVTINSTGLQSQELQQTQVISEPIITNDSEADKIARLETKLIAMQQALEKEQEARRMVELKMQTITHNQSSPKAAKKTSTSAAYNQTEKKILNMPSKNYALQILGSSNEQRIKEFIKENNMTAKAQYFKGTYQGKAWYILLYGNYTTREAATKAIDTLPANIKKLQPWPREYAQVQRAIKKKA